jgi:hypothetical protein
VEVPKATRRPRVTKDQAEWAIFHRFQEAYTSQYGSALVSPTRRERPDFSAVDAASGATLGIEVTGAYQDEREAQINYWLHGNWEEISGDLDGLVSHINRSLSEKAAKAATYEPIGPLVLAIWVGSFIFNHQTEIRFIAPQLTIPPNPFSLIALVIRDDRGTTSLLHIIQEKPGWRTIAAA